MRGVFAIVGCPSASFECSFYVNLFRSYCMCSMCEMCSERTALHSVQASVSSPGIDKTRRKANWPTHQGNWQGFWNDWKTLNHRNPAVCRRTNVFCSAATLNTELRSNCKSTEAYTLYSFPTQNQTRRYGRRKDFFQGGGALVDFSISFSSWEWWNLVFWWKPVVKLWWNLVFPLETNKAIIFCRNFQNPPLPPSNAHARRVVVHTSTLSSCPLLSDYHVWLSYAAEHLPRRRWDVFAVADHRRALLRSRFICSSTSSPECLGQNWYSINVENWCEVRWALSWVSLWWGVFNPGNGNLCL